MTCQGKVRVPTLRGLNLQSLSLQGDELCELIVAGTVVLEDPLKHLPHINLSFDGTDYLVELELAQFRTLFCAQNSKCLLNWVPVRAWPGAWPLPAPCRASASRSCTSPPSSAAPSSHAPAASSPRASPSRPGYMNLNNIKTWTGKNSTQPHAHFLSLTLNILHVF